MLLAGCFETERVQGVALGRDAAVRPLTVESRGGPWHDCSEARERGAAGDACDFDGACAAETVEVRWMDGVVCLGARLVRTRESSPSHLEWIHPCPSSIDVEGACVTAPDAQCEAGGPGRRVTACAVTAAPDDGVPPTPWQLRDEASCELLRASHAEPGDRCEGEHVCRGRWAISDDAYWTTIAWCDAGDLRVVVPLTLQ
ncbi:hypothetical protein DB32_006186 [Sandaracinus amylolyticus]|uniref:Uncharacterized protein n=1 Tax=Sandaracinus amylolyticus TaxID=927083 RepID=A0A0F6W6W7_9BACT|nr:hypothetical protein DB32_006186 [Sandaracinus amylolyticus]